MAEAIEIEGSWRTLYQGEAFHRLSTRWLSVQNGIVLWDGSVGTYEIDGADITMRMERGDNRSVIELSLRTDHSSGPHASDDRLFMQGLLITGSHADAYAALSQDERFDTDLDVITDDLFLTREEYWQGFETATGRWAPEKALADATVAKAA